MSECRSPQFDVGNLFFALDGERAPSGRHHRGFEGHSGLAERVQSAVLRSGRADHLLRCIRFHAPTQSLRRQFAELAEIVAGEIREVKVSPAAGEGGDSLLRLCPLEIATDGIKAERFQELLRRDPKNLEKT